MTQTALNPSVQAGGCLCGAIRYELTMPPLAIVACHCTDCQCTTGSAFGMSLITMKDGLKLRQGTPHSFTRQVDGGREKYSKLCAECGTRVWNEFSLFPQIINLKPGTLDDRSGLDPIAHIWTRSAQAWVTIPSSILQFETQPADFMVILKAWAERGHRNASKPT